MKLSRPQTDFTAIFRKPSGELVVDRTTYYSPASEALEAAEEDAHRYGWELVACAPSTTVALAEEFSRRLRSELSPTTLAEVVRRNLSNPPGFCASHDFCDANETMGSAAESLGVDPMTDEGSVVWTRAWNIAKASGFAI